MLLIVFQIVLYNHSLIRHSFDLDNLALLSDIIVICYYYFVLPEELNSSINFVDVLHLLLEFYLVVEVLVVVPDEIVLGFQLLICSVVLLF